jgi:hypothetical protein
MTCEVNYIGKVQSALYRTCEMHFTERAKCTLDRYIDLLIDLLIEWLSKRENACFFKNLVFFGRNSVFA